MRRIVFVIGLDPGENERIAQAVRSSRRLVRTFTDLGRAAACAREVAIDYAIVDGRHAYDEAAGHMDALRGCRLCICLAHLTTGRHGDVLYVATTRGYVDKLRQLVDEAENNEGTHGQDETHG